MVTSIEIKGESLMVTSISAINQVCGFLFAVVIVPKSTECYRDVNLILCLLLLFVTRKKYCD